MHRSDPKAGKELDPERAGGEAKNDRHDSCGHGSEDEDADDANGDAEDWEKSSSSDDEEMSTPVASRTRARSDSDNEPPRVVKRPNLGRPGCSGDISQQVPFGHGDQVGSGADTPAPTMNRLDPRAIYARQVAAARAAMQEVEGARGHDGTGHASEDSDEQGSGQGSQDTDENDTGDEADDEGAGEAAEEPDEEGAAGDASDEQDTGDGDVDQSSASGEESSQEAGGSLYTGTPSESDPSGSNSDI